MENSAVFAIEDVETMISDLEVSFEELKEYGEASDRWGSLTNNSCCHASCYTF
ncbi:MAG TPA: hypothetical protein VNF47_14335 [Streptosporangiaceae bacterium]|nr:hypothetical protein [Streptosporangiaceae bacterium]